MERLIKIVEMSLLAVCLLAPVFPIAGEREIPKTGQREDESSGGREDGKAGTREVPITGSRENDRAGNGSYREIKGQTEPAR